MTSQGVVSEVRQRTGSRAGAPEAVERVVLVHDYLTQRGGAERVVLAMSASLGGVKVLTSMYESGSCFPEFEALDVRPGGLQHLRALRRHHRAALPLLALAFAARRVEAEVAVCSTSGWAHGVRASGRKVLYVHNTARWLYQDDAYLCRLPRPVRALTRAVLTPLRRWDRRAAAGADIIVANSEATRARIERHWGRSARVIRPPHAANPAGAARPVPGLEPGFLLVVARLLRYKRVDAILEAVGALPGRRLVVVGDGPDAARLRRLAGPDVTFLRNVEDDELRWLYRSCTAVVAAAEEDFGLVPLEAMAFGKPVVARRIGGYLETVVEGETGIFFEEPEPEQIAGAVRRAEDLPWQTELLTSRAAEFAVAAFSQQLLAVIDEVAAAVLIEVT